VTEAIPRGVRLALDLGERRVGVAASDRDGRLAFPVATVDAQDPWPELARLVAEHAPVAVVVGHPVTLAGTPGLAADRVRVRAAEVARRLGVPVWLVDERMTTAEAAHKLREAGRSARQQRRIVDQQAAVGILDTVLAADRIGQAVGTPVTPDKEDS
jgi:putative Holliday junction resolvase